MATPPKIPGLDAFVEKKSGAPKPPTPHVIKAAAWMLVLAACVQVVAAIVAIGHAITPERRAVLEAQRQTMSGNAPSLDALQNIGVLTIVLACIATVCAYLLFAYFLTKGRSWARVALGILAVLTCVQLVGIVFPLGYTTVVQLVLLGLALVLSYLPVSNKFIVQAKAARG